MKRIPVWFDTDLGVDDAVALLTLWRLPELELRGGNLLTDGCRRVLDFTPQRICLDMGDTLVTLYGADLRIESFAGKRLIAAGRFARIELRSKWEVPQE